MKVILVLLICAVLFNGAATAKCHDLLKFEASRLRTSEIIDFCESFHGKPLLVVNTASQCGFTPQFEGLEALNIKYGEQLAIAGFPSDDFNQEYSDNERISEVCYVNYGVNFTMLAPSSVSGEQANDLFKALAVRTGKEPIWNFNKYLISADGTEIRYFSSRTSPTSKEFIDAIKLAIINN